MQGCGNAKTACLGGFKRWWASRLAAAAPAKTEGGGPPPPPPATCLPGRSPSHMAWVQGTFTPRAYLTSLTRSLPTHVHDSWSAGGGRGSGRSSRHVGACAAVVNGGQGRPSCCRRCSCYARACSAGRKAGKQPQPRRTCPVIGVCVLRQAALARPLRQAAHTRLLLRVRQHARLPARGQRHRRLKLFSVVIFGEHGGRVAAA